MRPIDHEYVGRVWTDKALGEHASVAAFARFVLQLMHLAAPPELLQAAIRAMGDEVEHARLCFGVAAHFRGAPVAPGELDLQDVVMPTGPEAILCGAIVEGCVNETLAASYAAASLERTSERAIRDVLAKIVEDEQRHAELSWDCVGWMLTKYPELKPLACSTFEDALADRGSALVEEEMSLEAYGHLTTQSRQVVRQEVIRTVIRPRMDGLVATA